MNLIRFRALAIVCALCAVVFATHQNSHAARKVNPKYFQYFPANSEFVSILGPLGALQQRTKMIMGHLKQKSPIGIMLPGLLSTLNQRLGFDILDPSSLVRHGLSRDTQLWFTGLQLNSPERFLGLLAPCDPIKVAGLIQKAAGPTPVHIDKFRNLKIVTLYSKPVAAGYSKRRRPRAAKGYSGLTYIARGKGLFFLAWTANPGESLTKALQDAKATLIASLTRKGATLAANQGFRKAISMARAASSLFVYMSGTLLKGSRGQGLNQLASGVLRQLPNSPLSGALRKKPQFKWGFVELRMAKTAIDLRAFVAMPSKDKDFRLVGKVFRSLNNARPSLTKVVGQDSLLTGKIVVDILRAFRAYRQDLKSNPGKQREYAEMNSELKRFQQRTGIDPVKEIMGLFTGHFLLNLYSLSPNLLKVIRTPKYKRAPGAVGDAVHIAAIAEVTSGKDASKLLQKLIKFANQSMKRKVQIINKYGLTIYQLPIDRRQSLYVGVLGSQLILALNPMTFEKIAQVKRKGGSGIRLLQRAILSRHGGLLFLNSNAIREATGQMDLPFGQRMIASNVAQYLQGILGIYLGFTVQPNGLGFGFGLRLTQ